MGNFSLTEILHKLLLFRHTEIPRSAQNYGNHDQVPSGLKVPHSYAS